MHANHPKVARVIGPLEHKLQTELDVPRIVAGSEDLSESAAIKAEVYVAPQYSPLLECGSIK
jgi:hypothetical protein